MSETDKFALVPRPPGALEKAEPGARRVLSGMVADTLALAKREPPKPTKPLRIVMVDDEPMVLEVMADMIRMRFYGAEVSTIQDGVEALQGLRREPPDLFTTGWCQPRISGDVTLSILKHFGVTYPILVISGNVSAAEPVVHAYAKNGLNVTFLRKPFRAEALARAAETALKIPHLPRAHWFREAAEKGDPEAQNDVGVCYRDGEDVQQDHAEAIRWFRKAAEQGYAPAQTNLGGSYEHGEGVPVDFAEAVRWYERAADQRDASALNNLASCYERGNGVPQDGNQAVALYRIAADRGSSAAQLNLGSCYERGSGVSQDLCEAYKFYMQAAENYDKAARERLAMITKRMTTAEIAEGERRYRESKASPE